MSMLWRYKGLILVLWFASGASGFIYWWRLEYDLRLGDIPIAVMCGFGGPTSWVSGCFITGACKLPPVIIARKRDSK